MWQTDGRTPHDGIGHAYVCIAHVSRRKRCQQQCLEIALEFQLYTERALTIRIPLEGTKYVKSPYFEERRSNLKTFHVANCTDS